MEMKGTDIDVDVGLEDVMCCIQAFVDILILCGGYQSTGVPALWDSQTIHTALRWATFVETVLEKLPISGEGNASKQALDMALSKLMSAPLFPRGLPLLSFASLAESRKVLLANLLQALNLRESHLSSVLAVACEMDSSDLNDNSKTSVASDGIHGSAGNELEAAQNTGVALSMDKQSNGPKQAEGLVSSGYDLLKKETINKAKDFEGGLQKTELGIKPVHHECGAGAKRNSSNQLSDYIIQELTKRHSAVSCTTSVEDGLKVLADLVLQKKEVRSNHQIWEDSTNSVSNLRHYNFNPGIELWGQWKRNSLSYLLDKRTVNMVSGARLIFDATKLQWSQVLESLEGPTDKLNEYKILELVELCLLGLSSEKWSCLIRLFTSVSYQLISLSDIWHYLHNISRDKGLRRSTKGETIDLKGRDIDGYLLQLLSNKVQLLLKMPPVLVASSLDTRSMLFALYMDEIQKQIYSCDATVRYFSSGYGSQSLMDCEIGERIWCFYVVQFDENSVA